MEAQTGEIVLLEPTSANIRVVALDEVAAYREMNGTPRLEDVPHLTQRVKVRLAGEVAPEAIEADVLFAMSRH